MYIQPNSTIRLMYDVPLTIDYNDTIYYESKEAQFNDFMRYPFKLFTEQYYQRLNRNKIRLQIPFDEAQIYTYLMFQNTAYGNKWFYAFVTQMEYVNDVTTEVSYEIDVMQTYHWDYRLGVCYVDRETSATDEIGDNIAPEPIDTGEIVCNTSHKTPWFNEYSALVSYVDDNDDGRMYGGLYSGVKQQAFRLDAGAYGTSQINELNALLKVFVIGGKTDSILSIMMCPTAFLDTNNINEPVTKEITTNRPSNILGYTPKNNKLFTYPYSFLTVDTLNNSKNYKFEYNNVKNGTITFRASYDRSSNMEILLYPVGYNNPGFATPNLTESITCEGFPQCSFPSFTFKDYAQKTIGTIGTGIGTVGSIATGHPIAGVLGITGLTSQINNIAQSSTIPDKLNGIQGSSVEVALREKNIVFKYMSVTKQYAMMIDDYFNRYGYATSRLKIPNRKVRPHWTYTKTLHCDIEAQRVPADVMEKIKSIYNNGITFWVSSQEVGHYSLDNSPVEEESA